MLKLLVVEDHALVPGAGRLLAQLEDDVSVAESRFRSALNLLDNEQGFRSCSPGSCLTRNRWLAGLDILRKRYPAIPVAVVSAFDDVPTVTRVMNHGASGFIPKRLIRAKPCSMRFAKCWQATSYGQTDRLKPLSLTTNNLCRRPRRARSNPPKSV